MTTEFGLIVIGDEILHGKRGDRHFEGIGGMLRDRGFQLAWLQILPDDMELLVARLKASMSEGRPVFSCGGIGATPDDLTRAAAAEAAGVSLVRHPGAVREIEQRFGDDAYPHRVLMADLPDGAKLIPNPYNRVPGFSINKHYFMPGFPQMAHPMAEWVLDEYYQGTEAAEAECSVRVLNVSETQLMDLMQELEGSHPHLKLFSLPRLGDERFVELGFRGQSGLDAALSDLIMSLEQAGHKFELTSQG